MLCQDSLIFSPNDTHDATGVYVNSLSSHMQQFVCPTSVLPGGNRPVRSARPGVFKMILELPCYCAISRNLQSATRCTSNDPMRAITTHVTNSPARLPDSACTPAKHSLRPNAPRASQPVATCHIRTCRSRHQNGSFRYIVRKQHPGAQWVGGPPE
jgi:hypothetical protein